MITAITFIISMANWVMPDTTVIVSLILKLALVLLLSVAFYVPNRKTVALLINRYLKSNK